MAKYYGKIGYGVRQETKPGVWESVITERPIYGDVFKNSRLTETNENLNDNINVSMKISFVADPYAKQNFHHIQYVSYIGSLWKVRLVEEEFPRLILTLGGLYNGK